MSGFYTQPRQSKNIVLQPATDTVSAELKARNAAAVVKVAESLDNATFGLNALERAGLLSSDEVPEGRSVSMGEAFATIIDGLTSIKEQPVEVKGIDAAGIKALSELVSKAKSNDKSQLVAWAGSVVKIVK